MRAELAPQLGNSIDEAELVRRARARDSAAFQIIMERHNRRLYRFARSILKNDSEAEDVVQEAYLKAYTHLSGFRGDASLATWLARITMHEALGRLRRQSPTIACDSFEPELPPAQIIQFPQIAVQVDPERTLAKLLPRYPDINVEPVIDFGFTDIVAEGYDAGIRLGEEVDKDMIAVRIGPDLRMAAVAASSYFAKRARSKNPQDLTEHSCINLRMPTYGGLYAWAFAKNGRELKVRVEGQLAFNNPRPILTAALSGLGIVYLPEDMVRAHMSNKHLVRVLSDWCPPFPGYHLYYPSRRQSSPAFALLVDALRYRG